MTDAMPLNEPIQEPAPGKIERPAPRGPDLRQTFKVGFDAVEASDLVASWGEPKPLPPALPEAPVMPESLIPPVLAPWLCDICERTQIPLDYVAAPAIVALSSVIGRTVGIYPKQHDDWLCVPNLWGVVIGRPGVLKSPALAEALKPLRRLVVQAEGDHKETARAAEAAAVVVQAQIDAAKLDARSAAKNSDQAKLAMAENDLAQLAEKLDGLSVHEKRYIVNDGTVEKLGELLNHNPRGLLLVRDELVGLLRSLDKQGHENDRAFYLESWAGVGAFTYDRIGRGTLHIPALTLSIVGGMTPGKLQAYINGALAGGIDDDGLLQRFQLIVWPEVRAEWENVDRYPDNQIALAPLEPRRHQEIPTIRRQRLPRRMGLWRRPGQWLSVFRRIFGGLL